MGTDRPRTCERDEGHGVQAHSGGRLLGITWGGGLARVKGERLFNVSQPPKNRDAQDGKDCTLDVKGMITGLGKPPLK